MNIIRRKLSTLRAYPTLIEQKLFSLKLKKGLFYGTLGFCIYSVYCSMKNNLVDVIYNKNEFCERIVSGIPELRTPIYRRSMVFLFRFIEIIYGNKLDRRTFINYEKEVIYDEEGDGLLIGIFIRLVSFTCLFG